MKMKSGLLGLSMSMVGLMAQSLLGRSTHGRRKNYPVLNEPGHRNKPSKKRVKVKLARKQKHRK